LLFILGMCIIRIFVVYGDKFRRLFI